MNGESWGGGGGGGEAPRIQPPVAGRVEESRENKRTGFEGSDGESGERRD